MDAETSYTLYNWAEEEVSNRKTLKEAHDDAARNRLDGFSIWKGHYDEEGEFVCELRVAHAEPQPVDAYEAAARGIHMPDDTPSLDAPWWKAQ